MRTLSFESWPRCGRLAFDRRHRLGRLAVDGWHRLGRLTVGMDSGQRTADSGHAAICDEKWRFSDGASSITCLFSVEVKVARRANLFFVYALPKNRGGRGVGGTPVFSCQGSEIRTEGPGTKVPEEQWTVPGLGGGAAGGSTISHEVFPFRLRLCSKGS